MSNEPNTSVTNIIVVGLDASPHSLAALRAATELASLLNVDLEGLFVEDIELAKLCQYPFQQEVRSYTGALHPLDSQALSRQMRAAAAYMRRSMEKEAARRSVRWRFQVRRGSVADELLAASSSATVMSLGRASRQRRSLGSTVRAVLERSNSPVLVPDGNGVLSIPFVAFFNGEPAAERALRFAIRLLGESEEILRVLIINENAQSSIHELTQRATDIAAESGTEIQTVPVNVRELDMIAALETGTLFLPKSYVELLQQRQGPSVVVP